MASAPQDDDSGTPPEHGRRVNPTRPVMPFALPLGVAAAALLVLLIPLPSGSLSVITTRVLSRVGFAVPGAAGISDVALVILAATTAIAMAWSWRTAIPARAAVASSAVGVGLAYGISETAKLVFRQPRPCGRWASVGACDLADYSFPSNHATLAFGAAFVIALATRTLVVTCAALALASLTALGRLLEGAHYLHDVAAGAVLGTVVPALLAAALLLARRPRARRRE